MKSKTLSLLLEYNVPSSTFCMKTLLNKIFVVAVLSVALVACSKEEVKPFNSGSGAGAAINATKIQDSNNNSDKNTGTTNAGSNSANVLKNDETVTTGTENGDPDTGTNITDGGSSSDYDSKGAKRKPLR